MSGPAPWGHLTALAIWIALSGALYLYFDAYHKPTVAVADAAAGGDGVTIPRSRDGHYYVRGAINGHPVDFMVDTGAGAVSVSHEIARRAGLPRGAPARFMTANGDVMGEMVPGQTVEAGGIVVQGLSVGVGLHGEVALLGQNFLRKVEVVQSNDKMVLRVRTR